MKTGKKFVILHSFIKQLKTMSTIIYPSPVFGPIHSRRLGISLGINLQPGDGKTCTFDCIYCECGYNKDFIPKTKRPAREVVAQALEAKLKEMKEQGTTPDVLTFAGNGEPTAHPDFLNIIKDTIRIRDSYFPDAKVSVLSNATMIGHEDVREALMLVDNNILKLDTVNPEYISLVDRPVSPSYDVRKVIDNMKLFHGHCIVQTMFMGGEMEGKNVDNTSDDFVNPWLEAVKEIKPSMVMIYTIDRETPDQDLKKASHEVLDNIKARVEKAGFACSASY